MHYYLLLLLLFTGRDRNDIYLTLEYGQFEKGSKRAERNVEIAIAVCDRDGKIIPVSNACTHTCTCRFMPCTCVHENLDFKIYFIYIYMYIIQ